MSKSKIDANQYWLNTLAPDDPIVTMSISLPKSLKERIEDVVRETKRNNPDAKGITVSAFIRDALEDRLAEEDE